MDPLWRERTAEHWMCCSPEVTTDHLHGIADKAEGGISESSFRKSIRHGLDVRSLYSAFYSWTLDGFKNHFSEFTMVQRTKWSLSRPDRVCSPFLGRRRKLSLSGETSQGEPAW